MRKSLMAFFFIVVVSLAAAPAHAASTTLVVTLVNQNSEPYGMHMVVEGPGGTKTAYAESGHTASVTYYNTAYFQKEHVYGYTATIHVDGTKEPLGVVYFRLTNIFSIYPQVDSVTVTKVDGHVAARASASPVIRYKGTVTIYAPR